MRTNRVLPIVPIVRLAPLLVAMLAASSLVVPVEPALAHHILGIPHYAYDERYPQVPILTYLVNAGPNEVKMTGYPGRPQPGEQCFLNVYIRGLEDGEPFNGGVSLEVIRDRMLGSDPVIYGPVQAKLEEAVYKFYPRFDAEANYIVRITYEAEGAPWIIDLPMVVGEPGSPGLVLAGVGVGLAAFLILMRAFRIKRRRRNHRLASAADTSRGPLAVDRSDCPDGSTFT